MPPKRKTGVSSGVRWFFFLVRSGAHGCMGCISWSPYKHWRFRFGGWWCAVLRADLNASSILASLSEAGGNDRHSSLSKPLPPRSRTCDSRLSECVRISPGSKRRAKLSTVRSHLISFVLFTFAFSRIPLSAMRTVLNPNLGASAPRSGIRSRRNCRQSTLPRVDCRTALPTSVSLWVTVST
jgi:hypothetical protein